MCKALCSLTPLNKYTENSVQICLLCWSRNRDDAFFTNVFVIVVQHPQ